MIRALVRCIARWHHRQNIKDLDYTIYFYEAQLRGLPAEIRRVVEIRRFHLGRLAALSAPRNTVNFRLGQRRSRTS